MSDAIDQYAGWLESQGLQHRPEVFRRWAESGYRPGDPSREDWPYDPYPLIVVTPPDAGPTARAEGPERR